MVRFHVNVREECVHICTKYFRGGDGGVLQVGPKSQPILRLIAPLKSVSTQRMAQRGRLLLLQSYLEKEGVTQFFLHQLLKVAATVARTKKSFKSPFQFLKPWISNKS